MGKSRHGRALSQSACDVLAYDQIDGILRKAFRKIRDF